MDLSYSDSVATQQQKMLHSINEIDKLTKELIVAGKVLNDAKGKYAEILLDPACH